MNVYRFRFTAKCPANGAKIDYSVEIRASRLILAEDMNVWRKRQRYGYHELIADRLFAKFGGTQRITASHHGIEIETLRP